ncbi:carbamoyl phosphate synthase large subunit [Campylobacter fetus subsp. testudinum]|uniref:Carbamoyl phosphate synthase large chain n=1 Tax=Campylobacter fetus subsp. testudinum TaxID=1507806 RepID=A0AAX0HB94_CAMFE|nr:carbamoyl-phosphate synthase large subunit [Campylobacter fetus]AVK80591.1 carbamoyl-phosphate synthase large subunit [Campylobacter fetus subsp. testudinum]MPB72790.1 carbamoyl-phosphate synthase large subunit [Campylobacter fetus]MPB76873.1 carbamoyl-phosphate synthase large subunit [Campylobacter fetus]OCR87542.1 carbamoyl phosphate synthase large subunit [Campylobacter fetus subsp. testudinum]OCR90827.1 carbamoyl phosphate synthase large subunit [Campylobacter fetus subsp. testudinum]
MPKREDVKTILLIGSGPIVIGQACEFDYSGTQAAKTLKELGYRVVLINSNPATIMTDPDFADATYVEPITKESISRIIKKENVDAILPTMGGQVALNVAMELHEAKMLGNVKFLGANPTAIKKGEDRVAFKEAMLKIGMDLPKSMYAYNMEEAMAAASDIGFPLIIRASYTLGGAGSGVAYNIDEFRDLAEAGIDASPINEILIEESLLGWKEFEMEVIRDKNDNCIIVCSIENFDPMGVHTGDSITVAPALTLTDKEYQHMRDASFKILREIGVDTGGSNVQFAINPTNGRMTVIEMNPRVSRSSALASKATGYPIAKVATMLAVGFTLDEIKNDITGTPASFEPVIDYIVTKIPRFTFEKFPGSNPYLGTAMKSVGEVMAIGSSFKESIQKALCSLEKDYAGFDLLSLDEEKLVFGLRNAHEKRILYVAQAFRDGKSIDEVYELTKIDPWFLNQIYEITEFEKSVDMDILNDKELLRKAKSWGFSDKMLAILINEKDNLELSQNDIYYARIKHDLNLEYREVDTCSGEFKALTPYLYSSTNITPNVPNLKVDNGNKKVLIIGGGPNRIGQGIEFDYCCVHASYALRDLGVTTIMYNCNPETVSTDYDTSDILYFEPIDFEHLRAVIEREKPDGVIVHFGGQTPLKFSKRLTMIGAKIIGTSARVIDVAEDRKKFSEFISKIGVKQPQNDTATSESEAVQKATVIGYPVLVRPSYVLGGRAMRRVHSESELKEYMNEAVKVSNHSPVLLDKFLQDATELDVDAISDGKDVYIGSIMEHIEEAGIHSGDSASILPPQNLSKEIISQVEVCTKDIALNLGVIGLMNIQFAVYQNELYIIEVNPRASRTVPFVSKATGIPMAKVATRVMWQGNLLEALKFYDEFGVVIKSGSIYKPSISSHICVKESVFPFNKLSGADLILGPEMKSTGEVMGISDSFAKSFVKSQIAAKNSLPSSGKVFISLADADKERGIELAREFVALGFIVLATGGTYKFLKNAGVSCEMVYKISEGRPNIEDNLKNGEIALAVNTSDNKSSSSDAHKIRQAVLRFKIPYFTNMNAALVAAKSISANEAALEVKSLQEYLKK